MALFLFVCNHLPHQSLNALCHAVEVVCQRAQLTNAFRLCPHAQISDAEPFHHRGQLADRMRNQSQQQQVRQNQHGTRRTQNHPQNDIQIVILLLHIGQRANRNQLPAGIANLVRLDVPRCMVVLNGCFRQHRHRPFFPNAAGNLLAKRMIQHAAVRVEDIAIIYLAAFVSVERAVQIRNRKIQAKHALCRLPAAGKFYIPAHHNHTGELISLTDQLRRTKGNLFNGLCRLPKPRLLDNVRRLRRCLLRAPYGLSGFEIQRHIYQLLVMLPVKVLQRGIPRRLCAVVGLENLIIYLIDYIRHTLDFLLQPRRERVHLARGIRLHIVLNLTGHIARKQHNQHRNAHRNHAGKQQRKQLAHAQRMSFFTHWPVPAFDILPEIPRGFS